MQRSLGGFLFLALALPCQVRDVDRDGDGLSDFHEQHKYLTDPGKADTDGDGVPDGDWRERREHQYTVRCVVQVMRPVTVEHLNDDYQDVRVLDETPEWVELEVILYPFNTVADAIVASPDWHRAAAGLREWTAPGPTADWTPAMRGSLTTALARDGIDASTLDDLALVQKAAAWLWKRAQYDDGFTTFLTSFDAKGKPFVEPELRAAAMSGCAAKNLTLEQQWEREISARGMFEHKVRGSCTSSAIYMNGCLRALGLPSRIVLCIPLIDASDEREHELVRLGLRDVEVRQCVLASAEGRRKSWASHTFNEVYVGGRWRRLNGDRLGQNCFDPGLFGLMVHVGTWGDWAQAQMSKTIGRRQALQRADLFGGPNPYSTIALRDEIGAHCKRPQTPPALARVTRVWWTDDQALPADVLANLVQNGRFGLIAEVRGPASGAHFGQFLATADLRLFLEATGKPTLKVGFDPGCWWGRGDHWLIYVPFGLGDRRDLLEKVPYRLRARNSGKDSVWDVPAELGVTR